MIQHEFHSDKFADFWLQTQNNIFLLAQNKCLIKKTKDREFESRSEQDLFFLLTVKIDRKIQNILNYVIWQKKRESKIISCGEWRSRRWKQSEKDSGQKSFRGENDLTKFRQREWTFYFFRTSLSLIDHQNLLSKMLNRVRNITMNWLSEFIIRLTNLTSIERRKDMYIYVGSALVTCLIDYQCLLFVEKLNRVRNIFKLWFLSTEFITKLTNIDEIDEENKKKKRKMKMKMTIIWMKWMRLLRPPNLKIFKFDKNISFKIAN